MSLARDVIAASSGYVAEFTSWPLFFAISSALALPPLLLLWYMVRKKVL